MWVGSKTENFYWAAALTINEGYQSVFCGFLKGNEDVSQAEQCVEQTAQSTLSDVHNDVVTLVFFSEAILDLVICLHCAWRRLF